MTRFAIIGCGHIARKHAEAIHNAEGAELIAVCDRVPAAMKEYQDKYNVDTFEDHHDLLERNDIDVVCICTPSGTHAKLACDAAQKGKHVVLEKPIALTVSDAERIIRTCQEHGVKLTVVHPNRFKPAVVELKRLLDENKLGKISHINATVRWNRNQEYFDQVPWRGTKGMDGGVLMNQAIHNLDLIQWLAGDVEQVFSMNTTRFRLIETEDVATGLIRFKDGVLGVVEAAVTIYDKSLEETLSIFGEKGSVQLGGTTIGRINTLNVSGLDLEETKGIVDRINREPVGKPGHQWIIEDIIGAIHNDREPLVSGKDGLNALKLVLALYESAENNQLITY